MTHYLRFVSTTDARPFDSEYEAVKEAQTIISRQKGFAGRVASRDGEKILIRDKAGQLVDGFWVEDDAGNHVHIAIV